MTHGPEAPVNGWQVDGFSEISELGAGAQGRVVLAVPPGGRGRVAIKYLAPAMLADERSLAVFRREAETLARVADPHVARLYRYVEEQRGAAIVMEAVDGASLRQVLDARRREGGGAVPPESALAVLKGSLLGLAAAHAVGVVHRDYKPANVVVRPDGTSKLIDFGIAVLSGQSSRAGTPAYMAPEQWQGSPASPATDLYAASCVLFECLTGAKPYQGGGTAQLMAQHLNAPVPIQAVPEPVRPLVARGMAKNPAQRAWDATRFVTELERTAVAAYGPDWERRGLGALAMAVAAFAAAAPVAMLGSFTTGTASGTAPAAPGTASLQQGAGEAVARHGRGFLRRAAGTKTAVTAAAAVTTAAIVAAGVLLRGQLESDTTDTADGGTRTGAAPTPTTVGGQATGTLRGGFRNPAPFGTSQGPSIGYQFTVTPARVKPGTTLSLVAKSSSRNPPGAHTLMIGSPSRTEQLAFYPVPPSAEGALPTGTTQAFPSATKPGRENHGEAPGGWRLTDFAYTYTLTVPPNGALRPGRYLVSPFMPPVFTQVTIKGSPVSPQSVGAYTEGTLPMITILPGTSAQPGPSSPSSPPATRKPSGCRTITQSDGDRIVVC
ncbi:serine/threonine-protein kinase [Spirillospora sp. CA-142024]|uniref:serine/threonine-protein kinase n=1 Tax=Spirillospora sp. CA-142024 TaxID=3240036 RepID=UPI003D8DED5B